LDGRTNEPVSVAPSWDNVAAVEGPVVVVVVGAVLVVVVEVGE
jgi:hypothetical protein